MIGENDMDKTNKYRFCYDDVITVDKKIAGIFAIKCNSGIRKYKDRMYIGESSNILAAIEKYREKLRDSKCRLYKLQYDWNELGEENFEFLILEDLTPPNDFPLDWNMFVPVLICRKHYYIQKHKANIRGYNLSNSYQDISITTDLRNGKATSCYELVKFVRRTTHIDKVDDFKLSSIMDLIKKDDTLKVKTQNYWEDDDE